MEIQVEDGMRMVKSLTNKMREAMGQSRWCHPTTILPQVHDNEHQFSRQQTYATDFQEDIELNVSNCDYIFCTSMSDSRTIINDDKATNDVDLCDTDHKLTSSTLGKSIVQKFLNIFNRPIQDNMRAAEQNRHLLRDTRLLDALDLKTCDGKHDNCSSQTDSHQHVNTVVLQTKSDMQGLACKPKLHGKDALQPGWQDTFKLFDLDDMRPLTSIQSCDEIETSPLLRMKEDTKEFEHDIKFLSSCEHKTSTPKKPENVAMYELQKSIARADASSLPTVPLHRLIETAAKASHIIDSPGYLKNKKVIENKLFLSREELTFDKNESETCVLRPAFQFQRNKTQSLQGGESTSYQRPQHLHSSRHEHDRYNGQFIIPKPRFTARRSLLFGTFPLAGIEDTISGHPGINHWVAGINPQTGLTFRDEADEAAYYLVTKYLNNKNMKW